MDSRFRGNDGGEAGIRRRESDGGGRRNSGKNRWNFAKNPPQFPPKTRKTPVIPAKAGIHFEEQNCEFTSFFHNGGNDGDLSVKMDSRFRGNDKQKNGGDTESSPLFYLPKSETMHRIYLESCVFAEFAELSPSETGGGADLPIVVAEISLQI